MLSPFLFVLSFTMHRCWKVPELTRMIFEQIDAPFERELYALARTCRLLSGPALDLLWKEQDSLIPLLKCLPRLTWEGNAFFRLRKMLQSAHWDRVTEYSRRIKKLNVHASLHRDAEVDEQVIKAVMMSFPLDSLLPNIHTVRMCTSSTWFPYIRFLLGPHLTKVCVEVDDYIERLPALSRLANYSLLEHLEIDVTCDWEEFAGADPISSYIRTLPLSQLKHLRVCPLDPKAFQHIAGLPNLRSLEVTSLCVYPFPHIGSLPAESYFPQIQRIDICPTNIALATHFMAAVNPKSLLRELSVTAPRSSARTDFSAFLSTLQHRTSLVSLTLDVSHARYSMASDDLRPLLALPNLKVLEFRTSYSTSIDDHFGTSMSLAWPLLISLDISRCLHAMDDDDIIPASYPTTETLVAFARNCPHLQSLAMNFDFTDFSEYAPPEPRVRQNSLTSVEFGSSLMEDPVPLAGLLSFLFPALQDIGPMRSSNSLKWERVAEMFTVFSIIREEERDYFVDVALELRDRKANAQRELNV